MLDVLSGFESQKVRTCIKRKSSRKKKKICRLKSWSDPNKHWAQKKFGDEKRSRVEHTQRETERIDFIHQAD